MAVVSARARRCTMQTLNFSFLQDSTFDFEKRRDEPVRYDRNLMQTTLRVMQRVEQVRERRQDKFWEHRMKASKRKTKEMDKLEIAQNIDLIAPAVVRSKQQLTTKELIARAAKVNAKHVGKPSISYSN